MKSVPYEESYNYHAFVSRKTIEYSLTFQFIDKKDIQFKFHKMKVEKSQLCLLDHIYLVGVTDGYFRNHRFMNAPISINLKGTTHIYYKNIPNIDYWNIGANTPLLKISFQDNIINIHKYTSNDITRLSFKCYYKADKKIENELTELMETVNDDWKRFYFSHRNENVK